ncbi:MAG: hypothetical protein U9Q15_05575 [Patescibacteria group bacterium]|nr:hypothetical protein [Patescibacteria group bacterium]
MDLCPQDTSKLIGTILKNKNTETNITDMQKQADDWYRSIS